MTYLISPADESKAIPALFSVVEIDHPPYGGQAHEVDVLVQLALAHSALQGPSLAAAAATGIVRARPGSGDAGLPQAQSGGAPHAGETSAAAAIAAPTVHSGGNCLKIGLPGKLILGDYFHENRTSRRPLLLLRISFPGKPIFIQFVPEVGPRLSRAPEIRPTAAPVVGPRAVPPVVIEPLEGILEGGAGTRLDPLEGLGNLEPGTFILKVSPLW